MLTLGCSEGQDATAWHTVIVNPRMQGLGGNPTYEAIECVTAPKQGRSGGGLFTTDTESTREWQAVYERWQQLTGAA